MSDEGVHFGSTCPPQAATAEGMDTALPVGGAVGVSDSLSSLTVELIEAHQSQMSEIAEKQELLAAVKERTHEEEIKKKTLSLSLLEMNRDLSHERHKISLQAVQEDRLRQEITEQLQRNVKLQQRLALTCRQYENEHREFCDYESKMEAHSDRVADCEKQGRLQCQIQQLEAEINESRRKKSEIEAQASFDDPLKFANGHLLMELQSRLDRLQSLKAQQTETIQRKLMAKENANERLKKIKRETEMLQRRNQAQMTRLKRQLQEAQARNRHWANEATRLQQSIDQIETCI
ncbi:meiosis-specific nuclear structural protein 1-like [Corticium candelabrum]|uniref:meiosis-specific nuclear structural protein 1-like n=1 Tax=Corticium candelabrum TaxID=121492 RepID=UPI002E25653F|nr:meiosis-specific nuclear structural protein 1-like [Corticium candelabrum]